jgi:hypothetical protein
VNNDATANTTIATSGPKRICSNMFRVCINLFFICLFRHSVFNFIDISSNGVVLEFFIKSLKE